jgi:hypothetical protein
MEVKLRGKMTLAEFGKLCSSDYARSRTDTLSTIPAAPLSISTPQTVL